LGAKIGYVYTGSSVLSWLFVFFFLGETRGRSLEDIDEMYADRISARKWRDHKTRIGAEAMEITEGKEKQEILVDEKA
jgi:SP family sugar:H+ symporter-like MFS transporter